MALFKIEKGTAANLVANRSKANEGWAYFTTDDGKFYIDIAGNGTQDAVVGTNRICLNSAKADYVGNSLTIKINNGSTENTSKYTFNGSAAKTFNITTKGSGIEITSTTGKIEFSNTGVTEIKGGSEQAYRTGQVNITAANILGSTAIGSSSVPVYWTGTTFATVSVPPSVTMTIRRWASA